MSSEKPAETRQGKQNSLYRANIPMVCFSNYDMLNHPRLHESCKIDRDIQYSLCIMCESPAQPSFSCKGCKSASYCSWECKVDDRQHHALVCAQWPDDASEDRRPSPSAARILIFPAKSTTPVFSWAELVNFSGEDCPRVKFYHPELVPWMMHAFTGATLFNKVARLGCINECRALAARKSPLGHGLFVAEWTPPPPLNSAQPTANISTDWINQSIQTVTSPSSTTSACLADNTKPGHAFNWFGPTLVISLDLSRTDTKAKRFHLDDVDMRDFRHAVDFFSLNLRNPCLPISPSSSSSGIPPELADKPDWEDWVDEMIERTMYNFDEKKALRYARKKPTTQLPHRFPFATLPAVKLNEPHTPVARALGIVEPLEEVCISRDLAGPPSLSLQLQGVSAVCAQLGLAWVVRAVLAHAEELDWLYDDSGVYPPPELTTTDGKAAGSGTSTIVSGGDTKRSAIHPNLDVVLYADEAGGLQQRKLPRSGDGMVLFHAGGGWLRKEHAQALLGYLDVAEKGGNAELNAEGFKLFWSKLRADDNIPEDVPSPYEVMPELEFESADGPVDRFLVCKDVLARLTADMVCLA